MGEWTILERLLEAAVQQHSTMIGRILLTVVVIFRILIVAIVGETVYEDEQAMFLCNTLQPGCAQACYDRAFPISHIRYWVFQIILVCTPSLCFITYSIHQAAKQREERPAADPPPPPPPRPPVNGIPAHGVRDEAARPAAKEPVAGGPGSRSRFYVVQVVFRNVLELGFLAGQYLLYGFRVPAVVACGRYPCLREVECYVSRPTEKSVFLVFMFAVSGVCVLLNLAELNHLGWRKVRGAVRGARGGRRDRVPLHPALGRTQSSESAYV
ncbi:gap junction delta-2 protein-like [Tachyglossus aculeatus]|uniref:gap junction delta-2 protein-like n=1 Tax=Tachyglossus aculeatus TaxID=9261 RepID=UPI0018F2CA6E|nr:gap junction delta-2 protein-like [Tachyglossus aculeatus]